MQSERVGAKSVGLISSELAHPQRTLLAKRLRFEGDFDSVAIHRAAP
jgi:hypothetical protein